MSTAMAIAATTRVLSAVIAESIGQQPVDVTGVIGAPVTLTSKAPDQLETGTGEVAQLALFLYHVTHNSGWREVGLPSSGSNGTPVDRPPLALDLHYLLIAYGNAEYVPQILLGLGMQALHESPVVPRQRITDVFTSPHPLSVLDAALATADLAGQVELIKVTPEQLTTDELSKLWTAFGEKIRPFASYQVTVVLIESTTPVASAPPVLKRNVVVTQLRQPVIAAVTPQHVPWQAALTLTLEGQNLTGEGTVVVFDSAAGTPQTPVAAGPGGSRATVTVPSLPAGINALRVVQQVDIGAAPLKNVVDSNVALFYLQPVIRQSGAGDLVSAGTPAAGPPPTRPVTVQLDPQLTSTQKVQLLLNELSPPAGQAPLALTFDAAPEQISPNSVTFTTFGTRPGSYLVRVRVDGAESALRVDPATGAYAHPAVTL